MNNMKFSILIILIAFTVAMDSSLNYALKSLEVNLNESYEFEGHELRFKRLHDCTFKEDYIQPGNFLVCDVDHQSDIAHQVKGLKVFVSIYFNSVTRKRMEVTL
jgi:hypothetical protein